MRTRQVQKSIMNGMVSTGAASLRYTAMYSILEPVATEAVNKTAEIIMRSQYTPQSSPAGTLLLGNPTQTSGRK
jgi:hypothetical protein